MFRILSCLFCVVVSVAVWGCSNPAEKPGQNQNLRPTVVGFYVNDLNRYDSLPSVKAHADLINEIHPLWYHVSPDGSLKKEVNQDAAEVARQNGIKIIPLVNVEPSVDTALLNQAAQDKAVAALIDEVKSNNYDGIDIDFEFFPASQVKQYTVNREQLTLMMKNIHAQMSGMGKLTYISVLPHVGSSPQAGGIYNYGELAPAVDKVTIMCYDYKELHSTSGPVAPFAWVEENIKNAINEGFRPEQISLGVATYGYDWPAGQSGGFSKPTGEIMNEIHGKGYEVKWSDEYQEPYYAYTDIYGTNREVWFENAYTLKQKMDLVSKYGLAGISIWRLGFEDQKFWEMIAAEWGNK